MPPFFSIIVPVYNHEKYIGMALDSILAQTDRDWEAIVVDDGSTDATARITDEYARRDARFRIIHKPNGGVSTALNAGIQQACGEWICWLSSDDLFDPGKLALHREWIVRKPDAQFFFTEFRTLSEGTGEIQDGRELMPMPALEWPLLDLLEVVYINGITMCLHREALGRSGLFDPAHRYGQDYDLFLRLLALNRVVFIPQCSCTYRRHPAQDSVVRNDECFFECAAGSIHFLSTHEFPAFVPGLESGGRSTVASAFTRALDVAGNGYSVTYAMGAHPALMLRILGWLWRGDGGGVEKNLLSVFGSRARTLNWKYQGTPLGLLWKMAAIAADIGKSGAVAVSVSPYAVASLNYGYFRATGSSKADSLIRYTKRLGQPLQGVDSSGMPMPKEILLVCRVSNDNPEQWEMGGAGLVGDVVQSLTRKGWMPTVLALGASGCGTVDGTIWVGAREGMALTLALSSVTPFDVLVAPRGSPLLGLPLSLRQVVLDGEKADADRLAGLVVETGAAGDLNPLYRRCLQGIGRARRLMKRYLP